MRVRDFQPSDTAACLRIFDGNVPQYFHREERAAYADFLAELPGPYLVVEDGTSAVVACGGLAIDPERRRADMCWGMVDAARHRQGVGRLLLAERIGRARAMPGIAVIRLNTSQHTTGFYARFGFELRGVLRDGYAPGLDRCDMELVLMPA